MAPHHNNELARAIDGRPDYSDDTVFPLLWSATSASPQEFA